MTCIVGIVHNKNVYLAGDSAGTIGSDIEIRSNPKVFKNNEFVIGYAGSFRMGQLLQYKFKPPSFSKSKEKDLYKFMTTSFVDKLRLCIHKDFSEAKEEVNNGAGIFIVGIKNRIFTIYEDYDMGECLDGYHAIGCANGYALGSLYSSKHIKDPKERLLLAMEAATHYSTGVRKPYHIISNE